MNRSNSNQSLYNVRWKNNRKKEIYSTPFHFDYVSLHKTSIYITISYRRSLISSYHKPISITGFGSTQLKNQQTFQHWTDILSAPNRPHVHWHILEPISKINQN